MTLYADGVDGTVNALQLSDMSSGNPGLKSNDVPYLNVNDNSDGGVELMLTEDAADVDKLECNPVWTSDDNDTVLLLDTSEQELADQVLCLQPTPVAPPVASQTTMMPTKTNCDESSDAYSDIVGSQSFLDFADPAAAASVTDRPTTTTNVLANGDETKRLASGSKGEPFGFVGDVMMNYTSPVKQSRSSEPMNDRRNLATLRSHATVTSSGQLVNETATIVNTYTVAPASADSDESL